MCVWENQSGLKRMLRNQKCRGLELTDEIQKGKMGLVAVPCLDLGSICL